MINLTKNNWLRTNIDTRREGFKTDFKLSITPYHHQPIKSFREECLDTAYQLSLLNVPLYLGLSGGYDSESVCNFLIEASIKFVPVIVLFNGNQTEVNYAYRLCDKQKLNPTIIKLSEYDLAKIVCKDIIIGLNGTGIYSVGAIVAQKHAKDNQGILLTGDHIIGDEEEICSYNYYLPEHDFYASAIGFFTYKLEVVKAMLELAPKYTNWIEYKHKVFNIQYRQKSRPTYSDHVQEIVNIVFQNQYRPVNNKHVFGSLKKLNEVLNV